MPIKMTLAGANPNFPCEVMGDKPAEVWKLMSDLVQVMSIKKCGNCESDQLFPESRPVESKDGKKFMGMRWRCGACGSSLIVRGTEDGTIYVKWDEQWFTPERKEESASGPAI